MEGVLFTNARLVLPSGIHDGEALVRGDRIEAVQCGGGLSRDGARIVDVGGRYLSPGFIDIHTHGAGGADFMDGTATAIYDACRALLAHGATCVIPTTITSTRESLMEFVDLFNTIEPRRPGLPEIHGMHLEGPYFAMEQRGAQDPSHMRNPAPEEYEEVFRRTDRVTRWSFAVELDGAMAFLRSLRERGIVSSLAHSDATCAQAMAAYDNGVEAMTHFYSGMAGVRRIDAYRVAGAIEAGYLLDGMYVEVIADGKHLPPELLQLIYKVKGPDRICLVSDSMRAAGMPDGRYKLGNIVTGVDCVREDDVAIMPDRTAFAGSVATANRLVRTMRDLGGAPLHEAVGMMSLNPARLMRIDNRKGSIAPGKDADLLVFDDEISISLVMARGEIAFPSHSAM